MIFEKLSFGFLTINCTCSQKSSIVKIQFDLLDTKLNSSILERILQKPILKKFDNDQR